MTAAATYPSMSLGKIVLLSVLLGLVAGLLFGALAPGAAPPGIVGGAVALVSVVAAGLIQPVPPKRRR